MERILRLKHITDYEKVSYYSVVVDQDDLTIDDASSLFEQFIIQNEGTNKEKLNHILAWLKEIGNKHGAKTQFFRSEQKDGEAVGLPPTKYSLKPTYTEDGAVVPNNLRLYCHRLNEHVVILFSGGTKTQLKAQECPNIKTHFLQANELTNVIDGCMNDEIQWNEDYTDIEYPEDLTIPY